MVREEARRTLLREYDKWAKDHPDDAAKRGGVVFFTYLQKERTDLLRRTSNRPRLALLHRSGDGLGRMCVSHSIAPHVICGKWQLGVSAAGRCAFVTLARP
jgi:hypothetical protein